MAYFLLLPTNENGVILDSNIKREVDTLTQQPFNFNNFFIYSHGWWTNASDTMSQYNLFSVELGGVVLNQFQKLHKQSINTLGIGIHWPSMLSEDGSNIKNYLEALSFYTMERRADSVGANAGYAIIRLLLENLKTVTSNIPININLIGHSFGCKVICSALAALAKQPLIASLRSKLNFNVILMQAAFDNNALEPKQSYGSLLTEFPNIRFLITTSKEDKALQDAYPIAHKLVNLFDNRPALGAAGPTDIVKAKFANSLATIGVDVGFSANSVPSKQMIVADLSLLHQHDKFDSAAFAGHHSDIFQPEIYQLICGFLFPNA
ncbi:MAG: alpha/beta hydrolase [Aulosira sp. ZfuVER01]|nr:alpha/beta hydrolase [Aulosira sp. ZfuVER01]MDZ8000341.1 alpha/beta hydrolase [Aulosira sp. DedVER01a]MDZ8050257.1 alpha/beta hydrolase [Aulosira sp. ZfuCHP01]